MAAVVDANLRWVARFSAYVHTLAPLNEPLGADFGRLAITCWPPKGSMNGKLDFFVVIDTAWVSSKQLASGAKTRGTLRAARLRNLETRMVRGGS
jgi:hypothetical protein